jgi:hypothetical protein
MLESSHRRLEGFPSRAPVAKTARGFYLLKLFCNRSNSARTRGFQILCLVFSATLTEHISFHARNL